MSCIQDLSAKDKIHLYTLLDRGLIVPDAVLGEDTESLRGVVSRNPLTVTGKVICSMTFFNHFLDLLRST